MQKSTPSKELPTINTEHGKIPSLDNQRAELYSVCPSLFQSEKRWVLIGSIPSYLICWLGLLYLLKPCYLCSFFNQHTICFSISLLRKTQSYINLSPIPDKIYPLYLNGKLWFLTEIWYWEIPKAKYTKVPSMWSFSTVQGRPLNLL